MPITPTSSSASNPAAPASIRLALIHHARKPAAPLVASEPSLRPRIPVSTAPMIGPLGLDALVWIDLVGEQPPRRGQRQIEGEARARREVLAGGDEERLEVSARRHEGNGVARSEHPDEPLGEPERSQIRAEQLQAPLHLGRKPRPRLLRAGEHARARIHAGHRNATTDERLGEETVGHAEDEHRAARLGQEGGVACDLAPCSAHHGERSLPFFARHVYDQAAGTGVPHRRPARCARGCVRRAPLTPPDLSLRAELRTMGVFPR